MLINHFEGRRVVLLRWIMKTALLVKGTNWASLGRPFGPGDTSSPPAERDAYTSGDDDRDLLSQPRSHRPPVMRN